MRDLQSGLENNDINSTNINNNEINNNEISSAEDNSKSLYIALKDDTAKVSTLTGNELYSVQLNSGKELIKSTKTFKEMNLKLELIQGMYGIHIDNPSIIQQTAVPYILSGRNVVLHSGSGTGKTIAFTLGAVQTAVTGQGPQIIILTPTRELTNQVGDVVEQFAGFVNLKVCKAVRNFVASSIDEEIVVGSPGKIAGLLSQGILIPENIKMVILDEADILISQSVFCVATIAIMKKTINAQKVLFSATYSDISRKAVANLLPTAELLFENNKKAEKIQLFFMEVDRKNKINAVKDLFSLLTVAQTIIFVATKNMATTLGKILADDKFSVSVIHGDLDPMNRDAEAHAFLHAKTKILVATDVFSRGMDIPQVNLIINFDMPYTKNDNYIESYIHRVGRSGRFNRAGFVIDFISSDEDLKTLNAIQSYNNTRSRMISMEGLRKVFNEFAFEE